MLYLIKNNETGPVSKNTVIEFENEFIQKVSVRIIKAFRYIKIAYHINRLITSKLKYLFNPLLYISRRLKHNHQIFAISMGVNPEMIFPHYLKNWNQKTVYFFDCWENKISSLVKLIKTYKINQVFISSKQGSELLSAQTDKTTKIIWIPEGICKDKYYFQEYRSKNIDILQLGRKYDSYHESIVSYCDQNKINYIYEKIPRQLIFKTNEEFYNGLSRTKISICFPQSKTHPDIAGNISTMTQRYLQSMLSKCLIVGELPYDMGLLFKYNPIINVDSQNPSNQIAEILNNFEKYIPLIEKNYIEVLNNHLWKNRISEMETHLYSYNQKK